MKKKQKEEQINPFLEHKQKIEMGSYTLRKYKSIDDIQKENYEESLCKDKSLGIADAANAIKEGYILAIVFDENGEKRASAYKDKTITIYATNSIKDKVVNMVLSLLGIYGLSPEDVTIQMVNNELCIVNSDGKPIEIVMGLDIMSELLDILTLEIHATIEKIHISKSKTQSDVVYFNLSKTEKGSVVVTVKVV